MSIDRRRLIMSGAALAASTLLPGIARAGLTQSSKDFDQSHQETLKLLRKTMAAGKFTEISPHPLVSGDQDVNGGFQLDVDPSILGEMTYTFQPCARIGDIPERNRTDLLPVFHVLGSQTRAGATFEEQGQSLLELLTGTCGLDKNRLAFASVPEVEKMRGALTKAGFDFDKQVHIRDAKVAKKMADSSGYFSPDRGNPNFVIPTCGVYYRLTPEGESGFETYPPPAEWTEVAEFTLRGIYPPGFALGVERLTLARSGYYPTWDDGLVTLNEMVTAEVGKGPPPPGLGVFKSSVS